MPSLVERSQSDDATHVV